MHAYWNQLSYVDILSMHCIESDDTHDNGYDLDSFEDKNHRNKDCCPRCSGCGCNYCLMLN